MKRILKDISNIFYSNFKKQSFGNYSEYRVLANFRKQSFGKTSENRVFGKTFREQSFKYI